MKRLYDRKIREGSTDAAFVKYNQDQLWDAVKSGWQGKPENISYGSAEHELLLQLRHNTQVFSVFKTHDMCSQLHGLLVDQDGKPRTWAAFKKEAGPLLKEYNINYLQAEYQTAMASARMAQKWQSFSQYGDNVLLTYKTIGDGRVREEHQILEGTTKAKSDPFWDTYYPPNGYRCRCYVRASPGGTEQDPKGLPDVKPLFRVNVGKLRVALPPDHPYYEVPNSQTKQIQNQLATHVSAIDQAAMERNFELSKQVYPDSQVGFEPNLESGGFLAFEKGASILRFPANKNAGKILSEAGNAVRILPVRKDSALNHHLELNGTSTNLRVATSAGKHTVKNLFKRNAAMGLTSTVADLSIYSSLRAAVRALIRAFVQVEAMEECYFIYQGSPVLVTREMALSNKLLEVLNKKALGQ